MAKKATSNAKPNSAAAAQPLTPPPGGAVVRMYRVGHGDCFLIAFAGEDGKKPAYVLIDCGYKPGSPGKLGSPTKVAEIGADIIATTGGFVDLAIVTHEHQDHVNGLTPTNFPNLKAGKVWFAWTEKPDDDIANKLRLKFKDRLLGLIDARSDLMGLGKQDAADIVETFLEFELGEAPENFNGRNHLAAAGKDPAQSVNKVAMKFMRDWAPGDPEYLFPRQVWSVPGAAAARAFVLGPPHDEDKIDDLDPIGEENFGDDSGHAMALGAGAPAASQGKSSPFPRRHVIPLDEVFANERCGEFFAKHYGDGDVDEAPDGEDIPSNAGWRRLNPGDAADAGTLALAMNNATNNASLVLAFELSKGGKVLLFVGDAQAGSWRSWADEAFDDDGTEVTAKDLLGRTVLYKVGHHGSHNATLNGKLNSNHPNLAWMAQGRGSREFTAMITAVEAWAHQKPKPDWNHPLPAIKTALVEKADGRVLQTDTDFAALPRGENAQDWQSFCNRVKATPLYFDVTIKP